MKPSIKTLGEILYSSSQYVIPVFQRNYRWETAHWTRFWESLIEIQRPEKRGNHFMGFLVFFPGLPQPGQHTTFHLVDGQQRLMTSSILLVALRNVGRQRGQPELADEIHQDYLVHPRNKGERHYRVLPKERDHDSYLSLVGGEGQATGRIADALAYFEGVLSSLVADSPEKLRHVFAAACQRLEFMCATLETENPYNIFKSLNSTGVPLGPSDLIRNFVFMHVPPDEQDEFDRDLWAPLEDRFARPDGTLDEDRFSKFFRDFLMSDGRYVAPKATFTTFESRYAATGFSPKDLARALTASVRDYAVISGQQMDKNEGVTEALAGLNVLESSTTYPLLLALFEKRARGAIDVERIAQAIEMLRGFILRRFVCGESSRGYGQMFVRALAKDTGDPIKTMETYLLDRGWPDDHKFETAFAEFPLYQRGYAREVLETLERAHGHKELARMEGAEIEHVMPQTLSNAWIEALGSDVQRVHGDWLHRPGNLTLSAYNKELYNHPFETKRRRYEESNIVLTRNLAAYDHWTESEIRDRGQLLAKSAAKIWIGPKEQSARTEPAIAHDDENPRRQELTLETCRALAPHKMRSLLDIIDHNEDFALLPIRDRKECSRMLNVAADLLWQRTGSGSRAFAHHQSHLDPLRYLERHPRLLKCVRHLFHLNSSDGRAISVLKLSAGQCSALMYLMACAKSDGVEYRKMVSAGENNLDWENWERASEFFTQLAAGNEMMQALRDALTVLGNQETGVGGTPPEKLATLVKGWLAFRASHHIAANGQPNWSITAEDVKLKYVTDQNCVVNLAEHPEVGGIDLVGAKGQPHSDLGELATEKGKVGGT